MTATPGSSLRSTIGDDRRLITERRVSCRGGAWIFLIFIVLLFFAVAFGFYTRRGSGINQRPHDPNREGSASGAAGRSRISAADDETEGVPDTHGTR